MNTLETARKLASYGLYVRLCGQHSDEPLAQGLRETRDPAVLSQWEFAYGDKPLNLAIALRESRCFALEGSADSLRALGVLDKGMAFTDGSPRRRVTAVFKLAVDNSLSYVENGTAASFRCRGEGLLAVPPSVIHSKTLEWTVLGAPSDSFLVIPMLGQAMLLKQRAVV
jgi:hypothetical protein